MLHAILRRKTGQSGLHEAIFERRDIVRYEGALTSAVFERLVCLTRPAEGLPKWMQSTRGAKYRPVGV